MVRKFVSFLKKYMAIAAAISALMLALAGIEIYTDRQHLEPPSAVMSRHEPMPAGARESSPDYEALRQQLLSYTNSRDAIYGVYFKDLKSGRTIEINADQPIPAASTVKVPVVLYLNKLVAEGKLDWDTRIAYDSELDYQDGAGILQFAARDGDTYSLRTLASLAITISDNIANRMLMRYLGRDNIIEFMKDLGGETVYPDGQNITTAKDMGKYVEAVLAFAEKHPREGSRLLDDMAHAIYHVGLPGELPPNIVVAHKEGDISGVANDVGIVFTDRPYILAVLSQGIYEVDEGFSNIAHISRIVYDYQTRLG